MQMLLLPEHYELMENGVVVFKLETGENLSLTADQYLILEDGLLLITDELAQASIYSLPVMGSVRAQLLSELEQVATIDGTVAKPHQPDSLDHRRSSTTPLRTGRTAELRSGSGFRRQLQYQRRRRCTRHGNGRRSRRHGATGHADDQ